MVEFHSNSFVRQVTTLTLIVRPNPYSGAPFNQCLIEYVSSSIHHYTIWSDKCYLLVHIIMEIHLVRNLDGLSPSPSATSSSPWVNDELLFQEPTPIVHFLRILKCHFVYLCLHLLFSDILSLRYHYTNRIWISVRYDGWDNFPRVMLLALWWPGNRMSCLAPPLAGGPIIMVYLQG